MSRRPSSDDDVGACVAVHDASFTHATAWTRNNGSLAPALARVVDESRGVQDQIGYVRRLAESGSAAAGPLDHLRQQLADLRTAVDEALDVLADTGRG